MRLLEADGWGEDVTLAEVWEAIEAVVPGAEPAAAVATITGLVPPPDAATSDISRMPSPRSPGRPGATAGSRNVLTGGKWRP